jgi:hypothetical protein
MRTPLLGCPGATQKPDAALRHLHYVRRRGIITTLLALVPRFPSSSASPLNRHLQTLKL